MGARRVAGGLPLHCRSVDTIFSGRAYTMRRRVSEVRRGVYEVRMGDCGRSRRDRARRRHDTTSPAHDSTLVGRASTARGYGAAARRSTCAWRGRVFVSRACAGAARRDVWAMRCGAADEARLRAHVHARRRSVDRIARRDHFCTITTRRSSRTLTKPSSPGHCQHDVHTRRLSFAFASYASATGATSWSIRKYEATRYASSGST